jgi:uncharacterized protein YndB with AHSA1/START domain
MMTDPGTASDREVILTRIFDAPRERVFAAWTDPAVLAAWYGPVHVDTPADRIRLDLRVGGRLELTMIARDTGAEYPIGYEIIELVEPELLVLRSDPHPGAPEPSVVRVELHDHGAKTRMTLTDAPQPPQARDGVAAGYASAFRKLEALLAT